VDYLEAFCSGVFKSIALIRVDEVRTHPVLTADIASIGYSIVLINASYGVICYCMTAQTSICCAHVRANEDIIGEATSGGSA
jgi:hypothetical protein